MANCYICGNPILDTKRRLRRKVRTGHHERKVYPSGRVVSVQTHYGQRIVCPFCAKKVDREWRRGEFKVLIFVAIALAAVIVAMIHIRLQY